MATRAMGYVPLPLSPPSPKPRHPSKQKLTTAPETWKPHSKWEYVPFNHGPRICIGQQFANFQMEYFLARLCQEFESVVLLPESLPQEGLVKLELNTKMAHPIYARCVRRGSG